MGPNKIWTAQVLEAMTPGEQDALFDASIVWDVDAIPPQVLSASGRASKPTSPKQPNQRHESHDVTPSDRSSDRRFFQDLDRQMPPERGEDGQPSRYDFQAIELLRIVERFATDFESLPAFVTNDLTTEFCTEPGCWLRASP